MRDKPVEGRLRARLELVDEFGFTAAPTKGTSPIGHCRPFRPESTATPTYRDRILKEPVFPARTAGTQKPRKTGHDKLDSGLPTSLPRIDRLPGFGAEPCRTRCPLSFS